MLLETKNLKVKVGTKEILKGMDFRIREGEVQVLLGPNGSGKSCFAQTISGNPKYKVGEGKIFFQGKEITELSPEKRAEIGIAMAWQSPPAIKGLTLSKLINKIAKTESQEKITPHILEREVNLNLSGGEKKISELLQIIALRPRFVVFDEIDSGLDIKILKKVSGIIKKELVNKNVSILLITHWGQILNFLKPDFTNVILDGKLICREKDFKKVLRAIKKYGYEKCKKCKPR